jgi:3-ketoacyl-CoA synthase
MMLQNTLFRCGGAAILLSSRQCFKGSVWAKYKLLHSGRVLMTDDDSYSSVYQKEDDCGNLAVSLSKNIVTVAGRALTEQFTALGPHVLPLTEKGRYALSLARHYMMKKYVKSYYPDVIPPPVYRPDFRKCIDRFCIHAGGRAIIEGVQKKLGLSDRDVEPSFATLRNYGNTSSSSIWYELKYIEDSTDTCGRSAGERVLQIAFGSGFKCNSAVWLRL